LFTTSELLAKPVWRSTYEYTSDYYSCNFFA